MIKRCIAFVFLSCVGATLPLDAQQVAELETRSYDVPPFFQSTVSKQSGAAAPADPFAEPEIVPTEKDSIAGFLESLGIQMSEGTSASLDLETDTLVMRNTIENFDLLELYLSSLTYQLQLHIILEYIEVEHSDLSAWLYENRMTENGDDLREQVQSWLETKRASNVETVILTAQSDSRAKVESIREYIYPTEFDPPEIPNSVELSDGAESPVTALTATAYETRHLGVTFEVDPRIGSDERTIDLNLAPEIVELEGFTEWPNDQVEPRFRGRMPTFHTQKITTQITLKDGRYGILGTTRPLNPADAEREDPIVIQFVRADIGRVSGWSRNFEVE